MAKEIVQLWAGVGGEIRLSSSFVLVYFFTFKSLSHLEFMQMDPILSNFTYIHSEHWLPLKELQVAGISQGGDKETF